MSNDRLLTIKEVAKMAGVSPQAVYKRLNNQFNQYIQLVENKKMVKVEALSEVYGIEVERVEQPFQPELNNLFNPNSTDIQPVIDVLKATIDTLQKQLEIKDQQIAQLQQELTEERKHSREQAEKITVLADQSQRLQMAQISSTSEVSDLSETTSKSSKKHWWQRIKKDPV